MIANFAFGSRVPVQQGCQLRPESGVKQKKSTCIQTASGEGPVLEVKRKYREVGSDGKF